MLWKSEKIFRADIRGMATVEKDVYGIAREIRFSSIEEIGVREVIFYKFYPS